MIEKILVNGEQIEATTTENKNSPIVIIINKNAIKERIINKKFVRNSQTIVKFSKEVFDEVKFRVSSLFGQSKIAISEVKTDIKTGLTGIRDTVVDATKDVKTDIGDAKKTVKGALNDTFGLIELSTIIGKSVVQKKASDLKKSTVKVSKSAIGLLKQKLKFEKNTMRFRSTMDKLNIARLSAENSILGKAKDASEKALETKDNIVASYDLAKEEIVRRVYPLKEKVTRKIASTKNIICRKSAMEIALFKDDIKKKWEAFKTKLDVTEEQLSNNAAEIAYLKEEKKRIISDFIHGAPVEEKFEAKSM